MFTIDPGRLDLAREFRDHPFGRHSGDLQIVLNAMRVREPPVRYVLVMTKPQAEWRLGRMTADPYRGPELTGHVFTRLEDAEWFVFRQRWEEMTGQPLVLEEDGPAPERQP